MRIYKLIKFKIHLKKRRPLELLFATAKNDFYRAILKGDDVHAR